MDFSTLRARVAYILSVYPATRDSDVTLQLRYWETFEPEVAQNLDTGALYIGTRLTSLARARAKIQNEYKLFQPTSRVRRYRRSRAERMQGQVLHDETPQPILTTYCDESGKNAGWLIVGGV
jgi:hypothetical protein